MNDNQETPYWLMKFFTQLYDPCPINFVKDGLSTQWKELNFVNPPYSNPLKWVEKAINEALIGNHSILLLRVDPSTKWYKMLMETDCHIAYFNERLHFNGVKGSPNFSSMLVFI